MKKKLRNYHSAALITGAAGFMGIQHALALIELNLYLVLIDINLNRLKKIKKKF